MPIYNYHCGDCEQVFDRVKKIADRHEPTTEPCPNCSKEANINIQVGSVLIGDPMRLGDTKKIDPGFRDVLRKVHSNNFRSNLNLKFN